MALTEGEQEIVEIEDELETRKTQSTYLLVGSLWSVRPFNHQVMMGMMKTLWRPLKGVDMKVLSDNRFLFTFHNRADIDQVMERQPWTFEKHVLILKEISPFEQPSKVILDKAVFWVRMIDLPIGAIKEHIIDKIGSKAGRVIALGSQKDNNMGGKYARARVEIDINKPLIRGTQLQIRGKLPMFIQF